MEPEQGQDPVPLDYTYPEPSGRRAILWLGLWLACLHFGLLIVTFCAGFGHRGKGELELMILTLPLGPLLLQTNDYLPAGVGLLLLLANSALWGFGLAYLCARIWRWRAGRAG